VFVIVIKTIYLSMNRCRWTSRGTLLCCRRSGASWTYLSELWTACLCDI